ncbi:MAG TPA: B12-binding domain-containing radical SAM protein [Anaerolineaceae bacterium]|nr:B12-binding domain-containing radical SAM protein [Anaerolineaceae bacterium]HQF46030.1 B12-binding domain-containing radical SAM protein [Anaerolineaceae bacterium]HQH34851.1 B12-binding domain-containing radical SAM protein [Anaerolineaceae bacterium]HQJ03076.1 B12-binding domain-containing radical SAM protein [Anaerolineaceae bacterium]
MKILMLYPEFPDTFWSFRHALQFVRKKSSSPPLGLITIAALLPDHWEKRLVDLNIQPLLDWQIAWADMVFISAMVVQRKSTQELVERCKRRGKTIVAGGPLFLQEWEKFPLVDHFILNEGELTLPDFIHDLGMGTPRRLYQSTEFAEMSCSPMPMWELVNLKRYDSLSIQYSRGCPFDCEFCNITAMLGHKPRTKSASQILAELDRMYQLGWRRNIFFVDDNFIGNKRQLKEEILPALIEWRKGKTGCSFVTEASINLADDPELMEMMAAAGFTQVFVGIETTHEASLVECNKGQNRNRNLLESVHRILKKGLQVMGGFIVGFDHDPPEVFDMQIDFIQRAGIVTAMVGMLQAIGGTRLYQRMESEGRIHHDTTGDNADGTTNIIPRMGVESLRAGYSQVMSQLYEPELFYERVKTCLALYEPVRAPVRLGWDEIHAFFRSIWLLGIVGKDRKYYWDLFRWVLKKFPQKLPLAITFSIYGYHFRAVNRQNGLI